MKGDPTNPVDWWKTADADLGRARRDLASGDIAAASLWLEQSAEKALKGWLIGRGWRLIKTHDIEALIQEAGLRGQDLAWFSPSANRLVALYFTNRYVDDSPDPEPDEPEARRLLADVERLIKELRRTLPSPPEP